MLCQHCYTGTMQKPPDEHPSYLVCISCGAYELTYTPLDYQEALHEVPITLNEDGEPEPQIIFAAGGYGSGKSRASLQEFFLRCLENPKSTALITAPTLAQLKKTTLKSLFNEIIPPPLLDYYNKSDMEIRLVNGCTVYAVPSEDEERIRSLNAGIIHLEEASGIKQSIYVQMLTRMRDPFTKVKTIFVCTNPDGGWVYDTFVLNEKRKNPSHPEHADYNRFIHVFIWATKLNKFLPKNFIEMTSKGRPDWWKRKFLEGSFEAMEGAVYPNASSVVIEPFTIPKTWERVVAADFGLRNPTAVIFAAIDPVNGEVIVYEDYYVAGLTVPQHAKNLLPKYESIPIGRLRFNVGDPSGRNRNPQTGKSIFSLYQEYGIYYQEGNNQLEAGILRVNSYMERRKLKVFNTCTNLLKELIQYKFPEISIDDNKNLDEKPVKHNDHACDALRYMLMQLPDDPDLLKTESHTPPSRYIHVPEDDYKYTEEGGFLDYV